MTGPTPTGDHGRARRPGRQPASPTLAAALAAPAAPDSPCGWATGGPDRRPAPAWRPDRRTVFDRATALERLTGGRFDVLVVGGGITGAGVALDAASRGFRTALVERDDFASGTSSASSKLVHGGLRYVSQGELGLVAQALAERQRLLRNAPHLVRPLPFVLPMSGGAAAARSVGTALWLYDLAGGARIGHVHRRLSAAEALRRVPALRPDAVRRAYLYLDAHADDARLTLDVVRTAVLDHGAVAANHAAAVGLLRGHSGRVVGARVVADGREIEVRASVVVNAAGVWSDDVAALEDGPAAPTIRPAKGVHLTVSARRLPTTAAAVLPVPADGRSIFVIPWPGTDRVYLGTTDTDAEPGPPRCTAADVAYLLGAVNASLADPLTPADVVGCWAGLRPLVAAAAGRTADLSRRHRLSQSAGGVVTITGGKLTTYRRMAADTVDRVAAILGAGARSRTAPLRLRPSDAARSTPDSPLIPGLPYRRSDVVHSVGHEMARTLGDVLDRRLRARILDRDGAFRVAPEVAALIRPELGWSAAEADAQVAAYRAELDAERAHAGLVAGRSEVGR